MVKTERHVCISISFGLFHISIHQDMEKLMSRQRGAYYHLIAFSRTEVVGVVARHVRNAAVWHLDARQNHKVFIEKQGHVACPQHLLGLAISCYHRLAILLAPLL